MGIVRENIDFQRGLDPKQSMDLGLMNKWMSLKNGDLMRIRRDFTTDAENHLDDTKSYHYFKEGDLLDLNLGPNKYSDGCIGFSAYVENEKVRSGSDFFMWGTPLEFDQRLEILTGLRENIHFERGIDPKDSMKIGRVGERDIKRALDKLVELRGGRYELDRLEDWTEGRYFMDPAYKNEFRADNFFIRFYSPRQSKGIQFTTTEDHFSYGYRIEGKVMRERLHLTAEDAMTEILRNLTPLPHG
jgi:hypothetical protein